VSTRPDAALAVLALSLGAVACSPGEPDVAPHAPVTTTATPAAAAQAELVRRPAELSLREVDPCDLLTGEQLDQLEINSVPRPDEQSRDGRSCAFDADLREPYYGYTVETVVGHDLRDWLSGEKHKSSTTTEPIVVAGFPALLNYRDTGDPLDCETLVGVAREQTLRVQMFPSSADAFDQQQMCDMSMRVATFVVRNLRAK
jgi:hypothetical protein